MKNPEHLYQKGIRLLEKKEHFKAIQLFKKLKLQAPSNPHVFNNLGIAYQQSGQTKLALEMFTKALNLAPNEINYRKNIIRLYLESNAFKQAHEHAITLLAQTTEPEYLIQVSKIFKNKNQINFSISLLEKLQEKFPNLSDLAIILSKNYESIQDYYKAIYIIKNSFQHHRENKLLTYLIELYKKYDMLNEALQFVAQQNKLNKEPWLFAHHAILLAKYFNQIEVSIQIAKEGLALFPQDKKLLITLALLYKQGKQIDLSLSFFEQYCLPLLRNNQLSIHDFIASLSEEDKYAFIYLNFLYMSTCHFRQVNELSSLIQRIIDFQLQNKKYTYLTPYMALRVLDIERYQPEISKRYASQYPVHPPLATQYVYQTNKTINLGYISSDFNQHAIGFLLRDFFKYHDRSKFKVFCYGTSIVKDNYSELIASSCDIYRSLSKLNNLEAAKAIFHDKIDILVDLSGFTENARPEILSHQPAPIQCHWMGLLTTLGTPFIQYQITTHDLLPSPQEKLYTEKIAYLPAQYFSLSRFEYTYTATRRQFNLPTDCFVFCNFSHAYRIDAHSFNAWLEILKQTPHSILWLQKTSNKMEENLREYAQMQNIDDHRIIFSQFERLSEQWPMQVADLWLEPFSYSSGTTAYMCLSCPIPLLTQQGQYPHQRLSANTLTHIKMNELIVHSAEDYVSKAIRLANDPNYYAHIKETLNKNIETSHLFKPELFVQQLEKVYVKILQTH